MEVSVISVEASSTDTAKNYTLITLFMKCALSRSETRKPLYNISSWNLEDETRTWT
jgi:hypothetical protein